MTVKEAVVNRFIELCKARNIKTNELANISGVTPSTVYSMMDARRKDVSIIVIKNYVMDLKSPSVNFLAHQNLMHLSKR